MRLTTAFLGPDADLAALETSASRYWHYPPTALHADVVPTLDELRAAGYRLGVIANQPSQVRAALERDGLVPYFETWGVSGDLGLHKPDPALFVRTLELAGAPARRDRDGGRPARLRHGAGAGGGDAHDLGAPR